MQRMHPDHIAAHFALMDFHRLGDIRCNTDDLIRRRRSDDKIYGTIHSLGSGPCPHFTDLHALSSGHSTGIQEEYNG